VQVVDIVLAEAAAEISGSCLVGNRVSTNGIEKVLVVAPQFDILKTSATTKRVDRKVHHMIRFVIRQMELEQIKPSVDGFGEPKFLCQGDHQRDAAVHDALSFIAQFVFQPTFGKCRPGPSGRFAVLGLIGFFETP